MLRQQSVLNLKALFGCLCVFASAFAFYIATVVIRWSKCSGVPISPAFFVFSRFLLGLITVCVVMAIKKQRLKVRKRKYLIARALANMVAAYCFFQAVDLTPLAQANILNMTYPLFIAVFSWIFLKEQRDGLTVFIVIVAFIGVWLILAPGKIDFELNSLWGLASGISAAVGIMYLNLSRQYHDTHTTLFYLFSMGSVVVFIVFYDQIHIPHLDEIKYLFWCSFFAISGQYLITIGFKYVSAIEGGIISSTRILLAAILGPLIAMDPALSLTGWAGALLIFSGNVFLTIRKSRV